MKTPKLILALLTLTSICGRLAAEDVEEQISAALSAFKAGSYSEAITALDYASQQIRQLKAETLIKVLPAAPAGWEAEEGRDDSMGNSMLGGMVQTKRTYRKGESSSVTVQFQSDSAMLQTFAMMLGNPMLLTASGAKLETIKGQKCSVEFAGNAGSVKTIVDGRYFVEISGNDISRDVLITFAKAVDYAKLASMK